MSWQLLVPIVEKILDAGVEYYKSDTHTMHTIAAKESEAPNTKGATILLAVRANRPVVEINVETLQAAIEDMATRNGLDITTIDISIDKKNRR